MELTREEYDRRSVFIHSLKSLSKAEKEQIFRLLKHNDETFSENSNGIFFDVSQLKSNTFEKLQELINLSHVKKNEQDERIKQMERFREEVPIEEKIV